MSCPVYRAEDRAWARSPVFNVAIDDPQAFVDWVAVREPFTTLREKAGLSAGLLGDVQVTITAGPPRQRTLATAYTQLVHIDLHPRGTATQGLLLHELAHLCSPIGAHHDHRFAAAYLALVAHWLGAFAAEELLRQFRAEKAFP
jgi:hypothetical protein